MTSPLVSADWLADHHDAPDVRVLDASWEPGSSATDRQASFAARHIPGAQRFDIDAVAEPNTDLPHMLPDTVVFTAKARKLGIGDGSTIVVYDTGRTPAAARAWWMFRAMGMEDVYVLDGGLNAWRQGGHPLSDRPAPSRERHFTARARSDLVKSKPDVERAVAEKTHQLVDARPAERFRGEADEPRPGLCRGHIPGAVNVPWSALYKEDATMKDPAGLRGLFEEAGITFEKPVIAYCGSGVTACAAALALEVTGFSDWSVYDGSWAEWGKQDAA